MAIIEQGNLSVSNALFGDKTFKARKVKVADFNVESVTDEWTENKEYEIKPGTGYDLIDKANITVNVPTVVYPTKGDVINIDMDGDGTAEKYLVLKGSGTTFEVLAQATPSSGTSIKFDEGNTKTYAGKTLDTYLNETYYATLSATAKTALVDKTFTQDSWYNNADGDPDYKGLYSGTTQYTISLNSATFGSEITRHAYAISIQDIIDYLAVTPEMTYENTTLIQNNIQTMFNETGSVSIWTRTASMSYTTHAMYINCRTGQIAVDDAAYGFNVRPAFQIDLSKITWTPEV